MLRKIPSIQNFIECEEFKCKIGGGCVNNSMVCDGTPQCADQSDEWNCLQLDKRYLEVCKNQQ